MHLMSFRIRPEGDEPGRSGEACLAVTPPGSAVLSCLDSHRPYPGPWHGEVGGGGSINVRRPETCDLRPSGATKWLRGPTNVLAWYAGCGAESMVRRCWRPDSNRQGPRPNDLWDRRVYQFRHASTYSDDKLWQSSNSTRGRRNRLDRPGNIRAHVWDTFTKLMHAADSRRWSRSMRMSACE